MNVLHAATAVVLYATARRLAVRRELAVVVVVAYLAICQSLYPYYEPVSLAEYEGINEWPPFQLYRLKEAVRPSD